jgi:hypothetical protein
MRNMVRRGDLPTPPRISEGYLIRGGGGLGRPEKKAALTYLLRYTMASHGERSGEMKSPERVRLERKEPNR